MPTQHSTLGDSNVPGTVFLTLLSNPAILSIWAE